MFAHASACVAKCRAHSAKTPGTNPDPGGHPDPPDPTSEKSGVRTPDFMDSDRSGRVRTPQNRRSDPGFRQNLVKIRVRTPDFVKIGVPDPQNRRKSGSFWPEKVNKTPVQGGSEVFGQNRGSGDPISSYFLTKIGVRTPISSYFLIKIGVPDPSEGGPGPSESGVSDPPIRGPDFMLNPR